MSRNWVSLVQKLASPTTWSPKTVWITGRYLGFLGIWNHSMTIPNSWGFFRASFQMAVAYKCGWLTPNPPTTYWLCGVPSSNNPAHITHIFKSSPFSRPWQCHQNNAKIEGFFRYLPSFWYLRLLALRFQVSSRARTASPRCLLRPVGAVVKWKPLWKRYIKLAS